MNPNDPAFPMQAGPLLEEDGITRPIHQEEYGLTKREYFAALAMQGLVSNSSNFEFFQLAKIKPGEVREETAKTAIQFADALIAELSKESK